MPDDKILSRLTELFRDILDDDDIVLAPGTVADDVPGWDSLAHVRLMLATEQAFGIRLNAAEIGKLNNVGDLVTTLRQKLQPI